MVERGLGDCQRRLRRARKRPEFQRINQTGSPALIFILRKQRDRDALGVWGYQSAESYHLPCWSPEGIITAAEPLFSHQREAMERAFGCPVFNTYGCREVMLIGAECPHHSGLHVSADHLVVEVLDEEGGPCAPGTSGEIVVTDLHNYGMPFVRYRLGDLGTFTDKVCACGRGLPLLQSVDGRILDRLRTPGGSYVPGEFFPYLLNDVDGIRRFQVIQDRFDHLTINIVKEPDCERVSLGFSKRKIAEVMGEDVEVDFEFVDEIPLTKTGKQRVTISSL